MIGRIIEAVEVRLSRMAEPSAQILGSFLPGRRIDTCHRRGKYIVLTLDTGDILRIHLRMTGRMIFVAAEGILNSEEENPPRHSHITLSFRDGSALHFADARTFGRMRLLSKDDVWDADVGIEPLEPACTAKVLATLFAHRRGPIKTVLLDQRVIAGLGNIYACEALWQARIDPHLSARELTKKQIRHLHSAIKEVLALAVEMRGTSARNYVDVAGLKGGFQNLLTVYGKHGRPCERCKTPILRTVLGQRGTWWCPHCQQG